MTDPKPTSDLQAARRSAWNAAERTAKQLLSEIHALEAKLHRTKRDLGNERYGGISNLGIVQKSGPEIDTLCALLRERVAHAETLEEIQDA